MVGVAGFEPTTSSSRTKHATKLRHTPREATTAYRTNPASGQRGLPGLPSFAVGATPSTAAVRFAQHPAWNNRVRGAIK